jgi:ketosteroid isomerase-like protein
MRATIFVAALSLLCLGCTSQQSDQLTPQQIDQIKSEIRAISDSIVARWNRLDIAGSVQYYSDSPDCIYINGDGLLLDYQAMKKAWSDTSSLASYKWTTTKQEFIFLSKEVVISAWQGGSQLVLKAGQVVNYEGAYTTVFKRIAGQWKVIFGHESGKNVTQKAANK